MTFSTFWSSLVPTARCDEPEQKEEAEKPEAEAENAEAEETSGKEEASEEDEEEEPEDPMVTLREECKESGACVKFSQHFEHCREKVEAGQGFKGEDCVEEMFHMMHCVDNCVAPKLFAKLV
ncbi:Non-heme protein of cytochrome bc1 complex [Fomitiporia mediterranea MF3/22]|uniref:Non-heme protein of cytochrome bc1 complex n=1 Tax=Fomitiporia mediterranea (strain MF3/22) TaxID=694068 RepID=UPI00044085A5|nr:Non-heme protein of cytochrome bc1 complex [Fomitiporia mediterranea MF3/22]EJD04743.1 Non-heme protein of cytochrome bc1 complex [Fomitiporia mediterranea MF3/22]